MHSLMLPPFLWQSSQSSRDLPCGAGFVLSFTSGNRALLVQRIAASRCSFFSSGDLGIAAVKVRAQSSFNPIEFARLGWETSNRSQSSERKSRLLARSEGLAVDQRAMNAVAGSVDMASLKCRR